MKYNLDFFTQYSQFYIVNDSMSSETGDFDFWSEQALKDRLAIDENTLGITVENDFSMVKGELEVLESENVQLDFKADHIVEGSLKITNGTIEIQDCPMSGTILLIPVDNTTYRIRIYSYNLNNPIGIDMINPNDRYRIEIWPAAIAGRKVLKRWNPKY